MNPTTTPTTPARTPTVDRVKDIAYKAGWGAVFVALGLAAVEVADLPPAYVLPASLTLNAVGAWLRQLAGHYAPPPADVVQSATVAPAITRYRGEA